MVEHGRSERDQRDNFQQRNAEHERDLERLAKLRIMDDDFMRCVFGGQMELGQDVLRILTGIDDLVLVQFETQKDLKRLVGARSVELDAFGRDGDGRWYDVEARVTLPSFAIQG